jgi:hypothetical protein
LTKYYFGTEFQSKTPAEKEAILREDEDNYWDDDEPPNAAGNERWSDQPVDNKAPDTNKHLTYKDVLDWLDRRQAEEAAKENSAKESFIQEMMKAGWSREKAEDRWKVYKLNEGVASGVADAMNVYGLGAAARAILTRVNRWFNALGEAGSIRLSGEPGKWVEVQRALGIEHQSKMSGKPIIERDGKRFIEEYEVNGVKFDNYKNGELYDYKGPQGRLINKNGVFYDVIEKSMGLRDDALRQANAAQGIPVIWKVGENQVKAFRKAVGNVPGVIIVP